MNRQTGEPIDPAMVIHTMQEAQEYINVILTERDTLQRRIDVMLMMIAAVRKESVIGYTTSKKGYRDYVIACLDAIRDAGKEAK